MAWRGKLGRGEARWVAAVVVLWCELGRGRVRRGLVWWVMAVSVWSGLVGLHEVGQGKAVVVR